MSERAIMESVYRRIPGRRLWHWHPRCMDQRALVNRGETITESVTWRPYAPDLCRRCLQYEGVDAVSAITERPR